MNRLLTALGRNNWRNVFGICLGLVLGTACVAKEAAGTDGQSGFIENKDGGKSQKHGEMPDAYPDAGSLDRGPRLLAEDGVPEVLLGEIQVAKFGCEEGEQELEAFQLQAVLQRDGTALSGQMWALPSLEASNVSGSIVPGAAKLSVPQLAIPNGSAGKFVLTELIIGRDEITGVLEAQGLTLFGFEDTIEDCTWQGVVTFTRDAVSPTVKVRESVGGYSDFKVEFGEPVQSDIALDVQVNGESLALTRTDNEMGKLAGFLESVTFTSEKPWPTGEVKVVARGMIDVAGNATDTELVAPVPEYEPANADPGYEDELRTGAPWWLAPDCSGVITDADERTEGDTLLEVYCPRGGLIFQQRIDVPAGATRLLIDAAVVYPVEQHLRLRSATGAVELEAPGSSDAGEYSKELQTYSAPLDEELGDALWLTTEIEFDDLGDGDTATGALYLDNLRFE